MICGIPCLNTLSTGFFFPFLLLKVIDSLSLSLCLQANERKLAIRKIPEQTILSEVRRMVEEMKTLNRKLEETVSFK